MSTVLIRNAPMVGDGGFAHVLNGTDEIAAEDQEGLCGVPEILMPLLELLQFQLLA